MRAIQIAEIGGPEVLKIADLPEPVAGPGELLVDVSVAGVNFSDVNTRRGTHHVRLGGQPLAYPLIPGEEGVGHVRAIGENVSGFDVGDRVVWLRPLGNYAEVAKPFAGFTVKVPVAISDHDALVYAQGLTAHYLTRSAYRASDATTALVHAAAGGVGGLIVQMLKIAGARVIATVSSEAKAQAARDSGADDVIVLADGEFAAAVRELTGGKGVDVVYDGVGKDTFDDSLRALAKRGTLVLYGASSGVVAPLDPMILGDLGSLSLIRTGIIDYIGSRDELDARAVEIFGWIADGRLRVRIDSVFPLESAADAHRRLESRQAMGKIVLTVR